ncbi:MAG: Gfo/Idh/MocA family oxidoreductase [Nocardioidaceae bacterium]
MTGQDHTDTATATDGAATRAPVRFGLVGTGHWAAEVHAAGVATHPDAVLAGVWGRDAGKAASLAARYGTVSHEDLDDLLQDVDAVVFSVPPDVQADLAVRAADAGRHLLLEKPVALGLTEARRVERAVTRAGVASVVFFTERFVPEREAWLADRVAGGCRGGQATFLASLRTPGNPFAGSAWRQQHGALWDVGPHALSVLLPALGPVTAVTGARGADDLAHLVLGHASGATSTVSLSLTMPPAAVRTGVDLYDDQGWWQRPDPSTETSGDVVTHHRRAVSELVDCIRHGRVEHRCDVRFGTEVVRVLEQAETVLGAATGRPERR